MIWHVFYTCPYGARVSFNTYLHWKVLVIQGSEKTFHRKEGFKKGEFFAMILYSLRGVPLIIALTFYVQYLVGQRKIDELQV